MDRLEGKVALITGGARGIGAAIGRRFREQGATVLINDLEAAEAAAVAEALGGRGYGADVADSAAVRSMFERISSDYERLDVLVNNAGIGRTNDDEVGVVGRARPGAGRGDRQRWTSHGAHRSRGRDGRRRVAPHDLGASRRHVLLCA